MVRHQDLPRPVAAVLRVLAVAATYYVTGRLGLLERVAVKGAAITPLWPPTGISLACLLYLGLGIWPGIALGALAISASFDRLGIITVGVTIGNTLAPVCAYLLLRRVHFRTQLDQLRDGLALVVLGGLAPTLVSATVGTGVHVLAGVVPPGAFGPTWSAWWMGDTLGVLIFTPLLLVLPTARPPRRTGPLRWIEPVVLLLSIGAVAFVVLTTQYRVLFLVFPLIIWAVLRFQLLGAVLASLVVSVAAVTAATARVGPFAGLGLVPTMVTLQALNGATSLTALLLAAVVTERQNTYRRIQQACAELAEVVERLTPPPEHRRPDDG
jgi:integral membrane sensor domain MASE1